MSQVTSGLRSLLSFPAVYDLFQEALGDARLRSHLVREFIRPFPGCRILDIGCGTAKMLRHLPPDAAYSGFDLSAEYIRSARLRYGRRATFVHAGVEEATAGDMAGGGEPYDIAIAFGVLHHLDDGAARLLFEGARRALKPSGRLITLDGTRVPGQGALSRYLVSKDRGRNVREPEGYACLGREVFPGVEVTVLDDALRIPYHHAILVCRP